MSQLRYTLLSDGSSNKVLLPVITWLLHHYLPSFAIQGKWSDLSRLPKPPPKKNFAERIRLSVELFPCDILFIHRDAEKATLNQRISEINKAVQIARNNNYISPTFPIVSIVPVRMLEAWFLFDLNAIRKAAGNPSGMQDLILPHFGTLEDIPDPKDILHNLLRDASGLHGRRLKSFNPHSEFHLIPGFIEDFGRLRDLSAFHKFENDIRQTITSCGWV